MQKNLFTAAKILLTFLLSALLLGHSACWDDEKNDLDILPTVCCTEKALSLMARLEQAPNDDVSHRKVVDDFIKEKNETPIEDHEEQISLHIQLDDLSEGLTPAKTNFVDLLRATNNERQNALHFLMARSTPESLATAKIVYDLDPTLLAYMDSYGRSPVDVFSLEKKNLVHADKINQLRQGFSVDFCNRLLGHDTFLHKIVRLEASKERNDVLVYVLKNDGVKCLDKMGDDFETSAELLVADQSHGQEIYNLLTSEAIDVSPLNVARAKKQSQNNNGPPPPPPPPDRVPPPPDQVPPPDRVPPPPEQTPPPQGPQVHTRNNQTLQQPLGPQPPILNNQTLQQPLAPQPPILNNQTLQQPLAPQSPILNNQTLQQPLAPQPPILNNQMLQQPLGPQPPILNNQTLQQPLAPQPPILNNQTLPQAPTGNVQAQPVQIPNAQVQAPAIAPPPTMQGQTAQAPLPLPTQNNNGQLHAPPAPAITSPVLNFSNVCKYKAEFSSTDIQTLEGFFAAIFAEITNGTVTVPVSYKARQAVQIGANQYLLPANIHLLSTQKIVIELSEVIYQGEDEHGNPTDKIKAAYDPISGEHLVKRSAEGLEAKIYKNLAKNPLEGVVKVHAVIKAANVHDIYMKRYNKGNLQDLLWKMEGGGKTPFTPAEKLSISKSLLLGLQNLHAMDVKVSLGPNQVQQFKFSHRDLKGDNIFCERPPAADLTCVIGDFDTDHNKPCGTPGFLAPEHLEHLGSWARAMAPLSNTPGAVAPGYSRVDFINYNFSPTRQKSDMWTMGQILVGILGVENSQFSSDLTVITRDVLHYNRTPQGSVTLSHQKLFTVDNVKDLALEWLKKKKDSQANLELLRLWDVARLMLQANPRLRPDAATALSLITQKDENYVMSQYFSSASNFQAKKIVGGVFHYCYIDMNDLIKCQDTSDAQAKNDFPGLNLVATVPATLAALPVKDLIAGPFNTCAILQDDRLHCFGREDGIHDLKSLNATKVKNVVVTQNAVIATNEHDILLSSPVLAGITGQHFDPATVTWTATDDRLYWTDTTSNALNEQALDDASDNTQVPMVFRVVGFNDEESKSIAATNSNVFGATHGGHLFGTNLGSLKKLKCHNRDFFEKIAISYVLEGGQYRSYPWFRVPEELTLKSGQKVVKDAWVSQSESDPVHVIGDADGVFDEFASGQTYRCFRSGNNVHCDVP